MIWSVPQEVDREIWHANRSLVLLHPLEPFVAWARQFREPGEGEEELEAAITRPFPFLVPLFDEVEEVWDWVESNHALLMETALWLWTPDESRWPEDRSLERFHEWFEVQILEPPWDVVSEPLHSNPPPAEPNRWD